MTFNEDFFDKEPRQTPGSNESTLKVLNMIPSLPPCPHILDAGCGIGLQTITIAKKLDCKIIALDDNEHSLFKLNISAVRENVDHKISTIYKPVTCMSFAADTFDLIWAEGSIMFVGIEKALKTWLPMLKENGYIAYSQPGWLTENPPEEIYTYWKNEYPDIKTTSEMITLIETSGYRYINSFALPHADWKDGYYDILQENIDKYESLPDISPELKDILQGSQKEIQMYNKFASFYSFIFYIVQKL